MNTAEKVCLKLCEEIFSTSSVTEKSIINYSVKLLPDEEKTAEVILATKEDEYKFILGLPEEEVYSEVDNHFSICSKCASKNEYNLRHIYIKGYDIVEFGKIDLEHLKIILEKLAENHARCIEENNLEKRNNKTGLFSVQEETQENFVDVLRKLLSENNEENIDLNLFLEGIETIENSYENVLKSNEEYVYIHGQILKKKLFVKRTNNHLRDYKILNIKTEQNFPLVYDLLLAIFSFTDQDMRQHYYHELLDHYYKSLEKNLQKLSLDIIKCLPLTLFHRQLHELIPRAKLEILKELCQAVPTDERFTDRKANSKSVDQYKEIISSSILEVNECILYPNLSREDCYKIVKSKIRSSDYSFLKYRLTPLEERKGYLGDYFKLKIEIYHKGKHNLLHFFAKYLPTYNDMALGLALDSFKKEEFYYLKFIPELNELGLGDITDFLPKCYFSRTYEVLVFDDMSVINYNSIPVKVPYTYEMLSMVVKQLAKVHACSLIYEEILSDRAKETVRLDEKFPEYVEEKTVRNTEETLVKKTFDCAIRTFLNMLNVFPDIPKQISMDQFQKEGQRVFNLCFEKVKKSDKFRNVLCQGDCWSSNILFKIEEDRGPIDCCLVDYQLTRYCPGAHDIYFLLYMATTKETRKRFESKLLREYYVELSNILKKYKVDLQKIFTYQEFLDSCRYMRSQGLCHAVLILQIVLFPDEKLKNIIQDKEQSERLFYDNRDILIDELKNQGPYSQRMKELAEELCEICEGDL